MSKYLGKREGYQSAIRAIKKQARLSNASTHGIAMSILADRRNEIERYVRQWGGQEPASDLTALVAQAAVIHENLVAAKQAQGVPDYEVAENAVLQAYAQAEEMGEVSEFDPATLGAIFTGAVGAVKNINAKRAEAGKPPLLAGKKKKELFYKTQAEQKAAEQTAATNQQTPNYQYEDDPVDASLGATIRRVIDPVREAEKKKEINKMLPFILIGAAVLVFVFMYMKKK